MAVNRAAALATSCGDALVRISAGCRSRFTTPHKLERLRRRRGLLAYYIPARRATKVDPMVALRYE